MAKIGIPKGTRDFNAETVGKRKFLMNTISEQFIKFGFSPIETPSFENLSTLTGKYGEEGDRLIFKILNSGDYLTKANTEALETKNSRQLTQSISEKALRYDLTVPFARFVVQHQNDLTFPFKRYQMQPVWRADRPQKGRFREFYQCDADVVGSTSLWQEVEFIQLYDTVFSKLNLPVEIHMNNRKLLSGLAEVAGISDKLIDFTVALDKLDKIGEEKVKEEMRSKEISEDAIQILSPLFSISGNYQSQLESIQSILETSEVGLEGIKEAGFVFEKIEKLGLESAELKLNLTLARGLDYYTGAIFEIKAKAVELGSIGGGGRYNDLTSVFGLKNMPGIGISFGLDRIYLAMEELELFPELSESKVQVVFINFGEKEAEECMLWIQKLRKQGINCELYPDSAKMKKQMQYVNNKNVPFAAIIGDSEIEKQTASVKNMESGEQTEMDFETLLSVLK